MTYPKSIGSLGLCYTDAEISKRKVTPEPCNYFAGQCMLENKIFDPQNIDWFSTILLKIAVPLSQ
jgi:hypothetical protein